MRSWNAQEVALAARAHLLEPAPSEPGGPERVSIDSRDAGPGVLFVGLPGEHVHGGQFAAAALAAGAWGVLTDAEHLERLAPSLGGARLAASDPLRTLQRLATAWRRYLGESGVRVIGVTGSTGKTSTKDLLLAVIGPHRRTVASRANFNTEIGVPLEILAAPAETEVLILEMAMRGRGQIAELAAVAEPDVGVIVSVGPVHLELLGTIEAIAATKSELIAALPPGSTAVVPADEPLLEPHLRTDLITVRFGGEHGDVRLVSASDHRVEIDLAGERLELEVNFSQAHLRRNLLAAVAAARSVGVQAHGSVALSLSPGRGQRQSLPGGVVLINDCYNANPMSMRAALDDLAVTASRRPGSRRVAVLGDMLELGPEAERFHEEIGGHASLTADVLITVGPLADAMGRRFSGEHHHVADAAAAAELVPGLVRDSDVLLIKASRGVALERVCEALTAGAPA